MVPAVEGLPTVEGFTPSVIWTTIYGLICIGLLFLIGYKIYDAIHTIIKRHKERREAEKPDFADKVSKKVVEEVISKLEPRFLDIERKLEKDKNRLEANEAAIESIKSTQTATRDGLRAICKFMLVISNYGDLGDNDKVKEANADLQKFLAEKL